MLKVFASSLVERSRIVSNVRCGDDGTIRILLITRKMKRRVLNEEKLVETLKALFNGVRPRGRSIELGTVDFENFTLADQIILSNRVDVMIGVHGAGLSNLVFMEKGSTVIEVFPCDFFRDSYKTLATLVGIEYRQIEVKDTRRCIMPRKCQKRDQERRHPCFRDQDLIVEPEDLIPAFEFGVLNALNRSLCA
jgi:protein O-GlcNAc transferase